MLDPLKYLVTQEDISERDLSFSVKVLQINYVKNTFSNSPEGQVNKKFKLWVRENKTRLLTLSLEELNKVIYDKVLELQVLYPGAFPEGMGWWSKQQLVKLYYSNKLSIENYTIEDQIREKEIEYKRKADIAIEIERKKRETILRLEAEELEKKLIAEQRELTRIPLEIGMIFKSKHDIAEGLNGLDLGKRAKHTYIVDFAVIEYVKAQKGKFWVVRGIIKPGVRIYPDLLQKEVILLKKEVE
ncbi:MAG: hypothetical protein M0R47_18905 [Methylobacter sp.]|uniref:hypothetical protein n=1 Tax=Methylobacter sp. TaxID=2051955 RepID=UPI0025E9F7F8|nr:hypothetical protein [Methylobacter sp.]MCK9622591.1 hypothetical protein [Methylobacter sp.]